VQTRSGSVSRVDRLDSWKEIAVHFGRTVRTVQRWERFCGMPVYRHGHHSSSSVYAFRADLDHWWASRRVRANIDNDAGSVHAACIGVVVLPFEDLSDGREYEHLCDGTVELITTLAAIPGFRVISRSSGLRFKQKLPTEAAVLAARWGIMVCVEGSVLADADRVHLNVRLADATDAGDVLWSEQYDIQRSKVLQIHSEIARAVASHCQLTLSGRVQRALASSRMVDVRAYDAYLRGRFQWNKRTEASLRGALEHFNEAIEHDPVDALGYAGLAETYAALSGNEFWPPSNGYERAKASAVRAIELDPLRAEPYVALAMVLGLYEWRWAEAEEEFQKALTLNPSYANAHHWYALAMLQMGRVDDALDQMQHALALDPLSPAITANVGRPLLFARRYNEAIKQFNRALEIDPEFWLTHWLLAWAYIELQDGPSAIRHATTAARMSQHPASQLLLAEAGWVAGESETVARMMAAMPGSVYAGRYVSAFRIARVFARMNRVQLTLEWLERSFEERSLASTTFITLDPVFDSVRSHPRFVQCVNHLGLKA
jgi:TolB-like protein/tetratricopeptide (TPR) repeat protein